LTYLTMIDKISAEKWADIVLERWIRNIQSMHIGSTGELLRSLQAHVTVDAKGDPEKITFAYLYYGVFVDMGVGRGVHLGDHSGRREKKRWQSSIFLREVATLGRMMAERYGYEAAKNMAVFYKKQ